DAGTGKTRVLKFIIAYYSIIHQVNIEITASTGKAVLELKSSDKGYCDWLRKVRAIIIDECSMVNDDLLDSIIHLFTKNGITELGKVHFIITGDFFQLPPASGEDDAVRLFSQKRFRNEYNNDRINRLPGKDMIITGLNISDYIKEICNIDPSLRIIKQITSSQDSRVGELLKKHKTLELLFMNHTQSEYVLRLRLNCRIMVIQNYSESVVNGSSGVFIGWSTKIQSQKEKGDPVIRVKRECKYRNLDIDNGERYFDHDMIIQLDDTKEEVMISVCEMTEKDDNKKVYIQKQFPVISFYAITVHKSQGTTLKRAVVDLRGCSQKLAYTAVSRVSTYDSLGVLNLTRTVYDRLTRTTKEDQ
ncbi:12605_t:CDS:2, partial [Racocetra persica]